MADYTIRQLEEIQDVLGDYPGEMRMTAASDMGTEQISFTWRRMPAQTGGKGSYGHRHKTQEEMRIAPSVVRSVWNEGPEDAVLIMCSTKHEDPEGDHETVPDFWPE
jgi:hypothetical protein